MTRTKPREVNLELGYSTKTLSEQDTVPTSPESRNNPGSVYSARRGMLVRQVPPAEESAESASKKRQCDRRHRSKERDECATRTSVAGGWPGREYASSLKNSWAELWRFLKECCRTHCPDADDRERCKGERQCGEDTDRRKERRESCYCQGTREGLGYGGLIEDGSLQRATDQVNASYSAFFI